MEFVANSPTNTLARKHTRMTTTKKDEPVNNPKRVLPNFLVCSPSISRYGRDADWFFHVLNRHGMVAKDASGGGDVADESPYPAMDKFFGDGQGLPADKNTKHKLHEAVGKAMMMCMHSVNMPGLPAECIMPGYVVMCFSFAGLRCFVSFCLCVHCRQPDAIVLCTDW